MSNLTHADIQRLLNTVNWTDEKQVAALKQAIRNRTDVLTEIAALVQKELWLKYVCALDAESEAF